MLRRPLQRLAAHMPLALDSYREVRGLWAAHNMAMKTSPLGFRFGGHDAMASGEFEPEETRVLVEHLTRTDVFVDVGANFGFYSCLACFHGVHCVAFEPHPENLQKLYRNIDANGFSAVEVFPTAVASSPQLVRIFGSGTGASLLRGWAGSVPTTGILVPATTLDIVLGNRFEGKRLFVKMDIEGAETDALRGATVTLARSPRPTWLIEICLTEHHPEGRNPDFLATFEIMWSHGYEARTADSDRRLIVRSDVERWASAGRRDFAGYNILFAPPS